MRLTRIRLHPFAGMADKTFSFGRGLQVVLGENEYGKSTLFRAIAAVLFKVVRLRKNSEDFKSLERCFPATGGAAVRVTLDFESDGQGYVLQKSWNLDASQSQVLLKSASGELQGDAAEQALSRLLVLNRASWERMLFIPQSSIHDTIEQLAGAQASLDPLQLFLTEADPFDKEGFVRQVRARRQRLVSRWDEVWERPEGGRGIENPWQREVGLLLESWYERERALQQREQILRSERRIGVLHADIAQQQSEIVALDAFLQTGGPLLSDASRSLELDIKQQEIHRQADALKKIQSDWLTDRGALPTLRDALQRHQEEAVILEAERQHAARKAAAAELLRREADVQELRRQLETAQLQLQGMPVIPDADCQEAQALDRQCKDAQVRLEAQRLRAMLEASSPLQVQVSVPGASLQALPLVPGHAEVVDASGWIECTYGDLQLRVVSGQVDVEALLLAIDTQRQQLQALFALHGVADLPALLQQRQAREALVRQLGDLQGRLQAQLGGRTLAAWEAELKELQSLPSCRDLTTLQPVIRANGQLIGEQQKSVADASKRIDEWGKAYGTPEALLEQVADLRFRWKELREEASRLQPLPEGYDTASAFIDDLQQRQRRRDELQLSLTEWLEERSNLLGGLEQQPFSADELLEQQQLAEAKHQQYRQEAKSLQRILEVHDHLQKGAADDPFCQVGTRMEALLSRLSGGKYQQAEFRDNLPVRIGADGVMLGTEFLSTGMRGTLALAVRLAYAEVYLTGMDGFMLLDDPFTELDAQRRQYAAEVLKELAMEKQIILFTCHPQHAALFVAEQPSG